MLAVEEEEEATEEEEEEDEEFELELVFDELVEFEELTDVEFDVVFVELEEPKRAVIGIPSVASEIADAIAPL